MVRTIVYRIVAFVIDNWKGTVKLIIAVYFITMGVTLLAGAQAGYALPMLNLTLPSI